MSPQPQTIETIKAELEALHDESFGWACRCCRGDAEFARDVLQASYLKVISGRACFAGASTPKTWFFGVIRLTAYEALRREGRQHHIARAIGRDGDDDETPPPGEHHDHDATQRLLAGLLATLAPRQREIIELTFYHGLTLREAADALAISVGSASQHYARAKAHLRASLECQPALAHELRY